MFCVIQEVQLKKPNAHGKHRELEAFESFTLNGRTRYSYRYAGECFERPIRAAYKISVHHSYRENGKVRKRQYSICTVDYYSIATNWFSLDDYSRKITQIADAFDTDPKDLYDLIYKKLDPLTDRIQAEYRQTEEYKVTAEHKAIVEKHQEARSRFHKKYGIDVDEYDYCFDVFGTVVNQEYLNQIEKNYKAQQEAARKYQEYSSYYRNSRSNYSNSSGYGSYSALSGSTYTAEEQGRLKKFYKALSMKYHPDMNPDIDTTAEMQLLNKLKEDWGL